MKNFKHVSCGVFCNNVQGRPSSKRASLVSSALNYVLERFNNIGQMCLIRNSAEFSFFNVSQKGIYFQNNFGKNLLFLHSFNPNSVTTILLQSSKLSVLGLYLRWAISPIGKIHKH
jgi:hypothetical protein